MPVCRLFGLLVCRSARRSVLKEREVTFHAPIGALVSVGMNTCVVALHAAAKLVLPENKDGKYFIVQQVLRLEHGSVTSLPCRKS